MQIPSNIFSASRTRYAMRKKVSVVPSIIISSLDHICNRSSDLPDPAPKVDHPNVCLMTRSICAKAAIVAAEGLSTVDCVDRVISCDESGYCIACVCVAMNIRYICKEARMNKHASGSTGRPSLLVRFWSTKAFGRN